MADLRFLPKKGFKDLIARLLRSYAVYGTTKKDGFPAFGRIARFEDLILGQPPAHLSAKEFFFPPKEAILRFDLKNNRFEPVIDAPPQAVVGLNACDIHALNLMDRVFAHGVPDVNYLSRRSNTIIIGSDCVPDEYCFCKSLGTMRVDEGFDLFLHRAKKGFLVRVGTEKGAGMLSKGIKTRKASQGEIKEMERFEGEREASFKTSIDAAPSELPGIYSKSDESGVWDSIGSICTGCGSCNNVCPTCYCFDVRDEMKSSLKEGERVRVWDGCTLEDFAKVAGGHNFRRKRGERLRHRFNRKFNYLTDRFGALFCVGCGRCIRTCLVRINIAEVTNELILEYRKRAGRQG